MVRNVYTKQAAADTSTRRFMAWAPHGVGLHASWDRLAAAPIWLKNLLEFLGNLVA